MSPATRPRVPGPRCLTHPAPPLLQEGALPESRSSAQRRPRPASSSGGRGALRGGEGDPGAVGVPHGPGRPPQLLADFSAETQVWGKLGPLWPCCNYLHPAGRGVSLRVGPLAPHSPPDTLRCHEFLGKGADRHSSKLERSPAGVGAGGIERNHLPSIEYLKIYYL